MKEREILSEAVVLVSSGVTYSVSGLSTQWAYKIPFAVQWAWPVPLWWLVRQGRYEDAERVVRRLCSSATVAARAKESVAMMIHTIQEEKEAATGVSYLDCFRGTDLRRTEVACVAYGITIASLHDLLLPAGRPPHGQSLRAEYRKQRRLRCGDDPRVAAPLILRP